MIIKKSSIKKIDKYLKEIEKGDYFFLGVRKSGDIESKLLKYGSGNLKENEAFLPRPLGKVTKQNINGKVVIDKTKKETRVFEREYSIIDWHGTRHTGIGYYRRECYARRWIDNFHIELSSTKQLIISPKLVYCDTQKALIKHVLNLFLEIFGEVEVFDENLKIDKIPIKKVGWRILPKGECDESEITDEIAAVINRGPKKSREIVRGRHKKISLYQPTFKAIGDNGFYGYVVYGFEKKNLYVFEANEANNATYVFKNSWEEVSKMTKLEIISGGLQEQRIIHDSSWDDNLDHMLKVE